jgi:hypothetical protein
MGGSGMPNQSKIIRVQGIFVSCRHSAPTLMVILLFIIIKNQLPFTSAAGYPVLCLLSGPSSFARHYFLGGSRLKSGRPPITRGLPLSVLYAIMFIYVQSYNKYNIKTAICQWGIKTFYLPLF